MIALACATPPVRVAAGIYVLRGTGATVEPMNQGRIANIAFIVGPRGVVVVDSGVSFREGESIVAAVRTVTRHPIRLVILTHPSQEVVFGAAAFQARGIPVLMHREGAALMASRCDVCLRNLRALLGTDAMAESRVIVPDLVVSKTQWIDPIGRSLLLLAPRQGSAPGALAVFDPATRTLVAGSLVPVDSVPDMRDAGGRGWRAALVTLGATRCVGLVPAYGPVGTCSDIAALDGYFVALEQRVQNLLDEGVGLAELPDRCDLPQYAAWERYPALHSRNASEAFLALERESFDR